jgi:hypothetical protein
VTPTATSARRHNATFKEYRVMACHVAYAACANTASISVLENIHNYPKDSPVFKAPVVTMRQSNPTHSTLEETARVLVSHIRHTMIMSMFELSIKVYTSDILHCKMRIVPQIFKDNDSEH